MAKSKKKSLLFASSFSIFKKELLHMRRNPAVLVTAFILPFIEFLLLGYMLDINVRQIDTVVYDQANTQESKKLIEQFANTNTFHIKNFVNSDDEFQDNIISGKAKIGLKIPVDYSKNLLSNKTATVLVAIDGSNASITTEAVSVSNRITLQESLKSVLQQLKGQKLPIEPRISVLFNPETRSPNFFLPGLIVFELPSITIILLSLSIAIEREKGTIEQLSITPINRIGLILGKMLAYGLLAFIALGELILAANLIFNVKVQGSILLLFLLSIPFIFTDLSLGLIVASRAQTQTETIQLGILFRVFPAFYMSNYIFPLESSPKIFQIFTDFVPHRYYMDIMRGIFLRGATIEELWTHGIILCIMGVVAFLIAAILYKNKI